MLESINHLIKSGQMSLDESSALIAIMPISPLSQVDASAGTPAIPNQPINFFAGLQQMMTFNESLHNDSAVIYAKKAMAALERLQGQSVLG
ncbi:MAG: hypothetical protein CVU29_08600 [Betaproteobacteria bacterium HGW-Betaproteobacteria-22]|nr:MAG: hypothetical protein CVU29_08600 [Betaproteobacteria bacterium HGW-Betaproteobacteria-22]